MSLFDRLVARVATALLPQIAAEVAAQLARQTPPAAAPPAPERRKFIGA